MLSNSFLIYISFIFFFFFFYSPLSFFSQQWTARAAQRSARRERAERGPKSTFKVPELWGQESPMQNNVCVRVYVIAGHTRAHITLKYSVVRSEKKKLK